MSVLNERIENKVLNEPKTETTVSETATNQQKQQEPLTIDRQTLIDTAVRFLKNPKVIPTPIENKRQFLSKKGLTDIEVEIALKSAGCYDLAQTSTIQSQAQNQQLVNLKQQQQNLVRNENSSRMSSVWFRLLKWLSNIILAGCLAFTAYKLLIQKYFLKRKSKLETNMEKMIANNNQLQSSIAEMRSSLELLKKTVETMNQVVTEVNEEKKITNNKAQVNSNVDSEIKAEVQSIKSLLLSRTQFPAPPTTTPILPTWQLSTKAKQEIITSNEDNLNKTEKSINNNNDHENADVGDESKRNSKELDFDSKNNSENQTV